jgi:hypothetical protein
MRNLWISWTALLCRLMRSLCKVAGPICEQVPFPIPTGGPVPVQGRPVASTFTRGPTWRVGGCVGPRVIGLHGRA